MKKKVKISNFGQLLNQEYGPVGSRTRNEYERRYEAFKLGVLIREARKKAKMTQHELAEKTGTKRTYISRIENDASDIRLSTLTRIVEVGLGGKLEIHFNLSTT
jgi:DNA-binding XRE family transcriptional regulator